MKGIERLTFIAETYKRLIQLNMSNELLEHYRKDMLTEGVTVSLATKGFAITHICASVPGMEVQVPVKER